MDCQEFIELAPAFALGALDDDQRTACAAHLTAAARHAGCAEALAEAQAVTAQLASVLPEQRPRSRVWQAIEAGLAQPSRRPRRRRRLWRELGGWLVAAAALCLYLCNTPPGSARRADATFDSQPALKRAAALLMAAETRRYVFESQPGSGGVVGPGRGSLLVNPLEQSAVVLVDRIAPQPGLGLRLWAVRAHDRPIFLARLGLGIDGTASAELGAALFRPALPRALLLSEDPVGAPADAPREVLLLARLDDGALQR